MTSRIVIYDKTGGAIAEIEANVQRTWELNAYASATFMLANNDLKAQEEFVQFGNFLVVEHEKLGSWAGMIDTPRDWGYRQFTVHAYSAEYILTKRRGPTSATLEGSPGAVFQQMVELANQAAPTLIQVGTVYSGGRTRKEPYNLENLYEAIKALAQGCGQDWDVLPVFSAGGKLGFEANWYEKKGILQPIRLEETLNLELLADPLVEQGDIVNDLVGFGGGGTWESRASVRLIDATSAGIYGTMQGSRSFDPDEEGTIEENTRTALAKAAYPRRTFRIHALDVGDLFYSLRPGNRLPLKTLNIGFTGGNFGMETVVRILGMTYDDISNKVEMVVDEDA